MGRKALILLGFILTGILKVWAGVYYVAPEGSGNTCTQTNPCAFQTALQKATSDGEDSIIYVKSGTYTVTRTLSYLSSDGDGSLIIRASDMNNPPVLDGEGKTWIMVIDNDADQDTQGDAGQVVILKGLIFRGGTIGLYLRVGKARAIVDSCSFANNSSTGSGGGVYVRRAENIEFAGNTFTGNSAGRNGGGIDIVEAESVTLIGNTFNGNSAGELGGGADISARTVILRGNTFSENTAHDGGGVSIDAEDAVTFIQNSFDRNSADTAGGAKIVCGDAVTFEKNTFTENLANKLGGGAYVLADTITLTGNIFWKNKLQQDEDGGGMYAFPKESAIFLNNTFNKNDAGYWGGGAYVHIQDDTVSTVEFYNNIFYGNEAPESGYDLFIYIDGSNPEVKAYHNLFSESADFQNPSSCELKGFCIYAVGGGAANYQHQGNIKGDPLFVNPDSGNLHLQGSSPAINMGTTDTPVSLPKTDIDNDPRIIDETVDIGADEFNPGGVVLQNQPPIIAGFTATPTNGMAPLTVRFDCQASDTDGYITEYRFDFDGDGVVDETNAYGLAFHTYGSPGAYSALVEVVDDLGGVTRSDTVEITVKLCGDANGDGDVDMEDAISISLYALGIDQGSFDADAADVDKSGVLDVVDALTVSRSYLDLPVDIWCGGG